ncbi:MAG: Tryptophan synthase alpha chain, partial [Myxococcaceae bacterium]|nr:Tryptophan synthase alpha chain [Myxococcaceae bacterium]
MQARACLVFCAALAALAGCDGRALLGPPTVSGDAATDLGTADAGSDAATDVADAGTDLGTDLGAVDTGADAGVTCAADETRCGGQCVDPRSDPRHCGACGAACSAGQVCNAGTCAAS